MKFDNIYILVPAFNEAKIIRIILIALLERFPNVVVINDGSTDNIMEATKDLDITLLNHEINLGVGAAVQTGFDYVQRIPLSYAAITFDADGQHSVEDAISIAKAIQLCEEEIIFGSRFIEHDKNIPFIKRNVLRFVTLFTKIATGIKLTDAHNGLKAYKVSAIRKLKLRFSGYSYESELITEVAKKKISYKELSTNVKYTEYSLKKGQKLTNGLLIIEDLLKLWK
jgi:glycosyltransferase involved in cell wall biosynthesis